MGLLKNAIRNEVAKGVSGVTGESKKEVLDRWNSENIAKETKNVAKEIRRESERAAKEARRQRDRANKKAIKEEISRRYSTGPAGSAAGEHGQVSTYTSAPSFEQLGTEDKIICLKRNVKANLEDLERYEKWRVEREASIAELKKKLFPNKKLIAEKEQQLAEIRRMIETALTKNKEHLPQIEELTLQLNKEKEQVTQEAAEDDLEREIEAKRDKANELEDKIDAIKYGKEIVLLEEKLATLKTQKTESNEDELKTKLVELEKQIESKEYSIRIATAYKELAALEIEGTGSGQIDLDASEARNRIWKLEDEIRELAIHERIAEAEAKLAALEEEEKNI